MAKEFVVLPREGVHAGRRGIASVLVLRHGEEPFAHDRRHKLCCTTEIPILFLSRMDDTDESPFKASYAVGLGEYRTVYHLISSNIIRRAQQPTIGTWFS